jgi:predicted membrane chloride channel (bestrophin family)
VLFCLETDHPFGGDENDLPTGNMASNIKKHVAQIPANVKIRKCANVQMKCSLAK